MKTFRTLTGVSFALLIFLIAGCNKSDSAADNKSGGGSASGDTGGKQLTVALMPKSKGNAYFVSARKGAEAAAKELGCKLIYDGPTEPDPAKQNEIVETWITRGVDVIAAAVENRDGLSTALTKAREKGIKVITWDSDAQPGARDFLVNRPRRRASVSRSWTKLRKCSEPKASSRSSPPHSPPPT